MSGRSGEILEVERRVSFRVDTIQFGRHTLMRFGIDQPIPREVELVHGPGCPVCVAPLEVVDKSSEMASRPDVIFVSYGDMLRVPGCLQFFSASRRMRRGGSRKCAAVESRHRNSECFLRHRQGFRRVVSLAGSAAGPGDRGEVMDELWTPACSRNPHDASR